MQGVGASGARLNHHQGAEHAHCAAAERRDNRINLRQLLRKVHRPDELAIRCPCGDKGPVFLHATSAASMDPDVPLKAARKEIPAYQPELSGSQGSWQCLHCRRAKTPFKPPMQQASHALGASTVKKLFGFLGRVYSSTPTNLAGR